MLCSNPSMRRTECRLAVSGILGCETVVCPFDFGRGFDILFLNPYNTVKLIYYID